MEGFGGEMRIKKVIAIFLAITMVLCYMPATSAANTSADSTEIINVSDESLPDAVLKPLVDMPKDGFWSTVALKAAISNGLLNGFSEKDGAYIRPDGPLTRAQIAAIVNRAFGAKETSSLSGVLDVSVGEWYYKDIQKALKMGTMKLDTTMRPNDNITRQEAFTILGRALKIEDGSKADLTKFSDASQVASWATSCMGAMVKAGYIKGDNNLLNPTANMTRAQVAVIMDSVIKEYIKDPGTVTKVEPGSVLVNVAGVTVKDVTITGDLIIGDGVGDGTVTLKNVIVKGNLIARGGGVDSIIISGGRVDGKVVIAKVDGKIRVFVEGGAEVETVEIEDGKDDVIIEGTFGTVEVISSDTPVVFRNASVTNIEVNTVGAGNITVGLGSNVGSVVIKSSAIGTKVDVAGRVTNLETSAENTTIAGKGIIINATFKKGAEGSSIDTPNTIVTSELPKEAIVIGGGDSEDKGPRIYSIGSAEIIGAHFVGSKLSAKVKPARSAGYYQWMRSDTKDGIYTNIGGATSETYRLTVGDLGKFIKVEAVGAGRFIGTTTSGATNAVTYLEMTSKEAEAAGFLWDIIDYFEWCEAPFAGEIQLYWGSDKDLIIPAKIDGIAVTTIGESAFEGKQLTSITIPNSVTTLGACAFTNNNLTSVTIPDSLKIIAVDAFWYNKLTSITIPASVVEIQGGAFANNELNSLIIPNSVKKIEGGAFNNNKLPDGQAFIYARNSDGAEDLTEVISYGGANKENIQIPRTVTTISSGAFSYCDLKSIEIFSGVKEIGCEAFQGNQLATVVIPTSVTTIGNIAFKGNNLTSVTIPNTITTIGEETFKNNRLTTVEIPELVTTIGTQAFMNNSLTSVTIPNSVTTIGPEAFMENNLTSVTIPGSVTLIDESVFKDNNLASVTIGSGVTTIGGSAFNNNKLTSLIIPDSVTTIGNRAFIDNQLTAVTMTGVTAVGDYAFFRNQLISVSLGNVQTIGFQAFSANTIAAITIPNSVTQIGEFAFSNNNLTSVTIQSITTAISGGAFNNNQLPDDKAFIYARNSGGLDTTKVISYGGSKRAGVLVPSSVTKIGDLAFSSNDLTSITMGDLVTTIGIRAFSYNKLSAITIPNTVTTIAWGAFESNGPNKNSGNITTAEGIAYPGIWTLDTANPPKWIR